MMMMTIKSQKCAFFRASRPVFRPTPPGGPVKKPDCSGFCHSSLKTVCYPVRIIIPRLLFCPVQRVSSLALLTFFAAQSRRSRTDYTVCDNLSALPRFSVLPSPLADLHVTRHAQEFTLAVPFQCFGLSAKCQDG